MHSGHSVLLLLGGGVSYNRGIQSKWHFCVTAGTCAIAFFFSPIFCQGEVFDIGEGILELWHWFTRLPEKFPRHCAAIHTLSDCVFPNCFCAYINIQLKLTSASNSWCSGGWRCIGVMHLPFVFGDLSLQLQLYEVQLGWRELVAGSYGLNARHREETLKRRGDIALKRGINT